MGGDDGRYGWLGLPGDPAPAVIAISLRKNTDFAWLITTAALSESSVKQIGILARSCEVGWEQCFGTVKLGGADVFVYVSVTLNREEIDWPGLRAAAVAVGIRRAARQAAHDLPPDEKERFIQRAMKRCSREKWLIKSQQDKACAVATSPTALSANVRKGSDVLSDVLAEDSRATRIGLSAAARKAAETLAKMPGSKVIKHAQAHRHMTASSSVLHSWDDKGNPKPFTLNVLNINSLQIDQDNPETRYDCATAPAAITCNQPMQSAGGSVPAQGFNGQAAQK